MKNRGKLSGTLPRRSNISDKEEIKIIKIKYERALADPPVACA